MCNPAAALSIAASAGGQLINGMEASANNRRIIEARNAATQAELARQHGYQDQSGAIFDTQMGNWTPAVQGQRLNGAQTAATGFFNSTAPTAANVGTIGFNDAGAASKAAEAKSIADAFTAANTRTDALGKLSGWDQLGFDNKVSLAGSGRQLGTISDLSSNSARVGDFEREVNGMNAYRPPSGLGDLLGFAGNLAGSGRLGGFGGGGGATSMPTSSMWGVYRPPASNTAWV